MNARARIPLLLLAVPIVTSAQQPLTLQEAVSRSSATYPAVRSSMEQVAAATEGINLARTAFLPRAEFIGQINRATHNNVFGLLLPQSVIPSMSGPVLQTNSLSSVRGSARVEPGDRDAGQKRTPSGSGRIQIASRTGAGSEPVDSGRTQSAGDGNTAGPQSEMAFIRPGGDVS